jgi:hypothetical protein
MLIETAELDSLLAAIVESSDDAIIRKDPNGVITIANKKPRWARRSRICCGATPRGLRTSVPEDQHRPEPNHRTATARERHRVAPRRYAR